MTEAFAREFHRKVFGAPLPVSQSLRDVADRPISYLFTDWKNSLDLDHPETFAECVLPNGHYFIPTQSEVADRVHEIGHWNSSWSYFRQQIARANAPSLQADGVLDLDKGDWLRTMTVDEVISVSSYMSLSTLEPASFRTVDFEPGLVSAKYLKLPWMHELGPMLLATRIDSIWQRKDWRVGDFSIGEMVHAISRYPSALSRLPPTFDATAQRIELVRQGDKIRPFAGEAWMSFALMAFHVSVDKFRSFEATVELACRYAELGLEVEALQPYVTMFNDDVESIRRLLDNGISADMLSELS